MPKPELDAVVIGGGPGGSAAATFLARSGRRILLLEKERFPRFHIGESLLPYNHELFDQLGLLPSLHAAGFLVKHGAQFHAGNGKYATHFIFRQGAFTKHPTAFQVERATFDHLLLQHARQSGVDVREGWTVLSAESAPDHRRVAARDPEGKTHSFEASFVLDASGRTNLTANHEGLRQPHPRHRKLAIFSHFSGVHLDPGDSGGDTVIVRLKEGWFWFIPLSRDKVSVGLVVDESTVRANRNSPADLFRQYSEQTPAAADRLRQATPLMPLQVTTDFSYFNRRLVGPRLARVGDAAGFLDPIFSAGVYLAMLSGIEAARVVAGALEARGDGDEALRRYERRTRAAMRTYWRMVEMFYTQPFMELFLNPREKHKIASAVNALLAGELSGGWRIRWRMALFYLFVRLQRHWPLVPRVPLG